MVQYPHSISITNSNLSQDGLGNFSVLTGSGFTSICRAEPNTGNQTVNGVDGASVLFQYTVYMPKQAVIIPFGSIVEITLPNGGIFNGYVKGVDNVSRLNTRLWV